MSTRSVAERLQVKGDRTLCLVDPPAAGSADLAGLATVAEPSVADVVLLFATSRQGLVRQVEDVGPTLKTGVVFWTAYPKLSSGSAGELNRDLVHDTLLDLGWRTVAAISLDETWSAMRHKPATQARAAA